MPRPKKERASKYEEKVKLSTNLDQTLKLISKAAKKKNKGNTPPPKQ